MGFRCPVCEEPQADAAHLANHLAFTALIHGGDHETWLDEYVEEWDQLGEDGLAERVREFADDADYPQVFEDTTGQGYAEEHEGMHADQGDHAGHTHDSAHDGHAHQGHAHETATEDTLPPGAAAMTGDLDEDTEAVIQEAIEMTQQRQDDSEKDSGHATNEDSDQGDVKADETEETGDDS